MPGKSVYWPIKMKTKKNRKKKNRIVVLASRSLLLKQQQMKDPQPWRKKQIDTIQKQLNKHGVSLDNFISEG